MADQINVCQIKFLIMEWITSVDEHKSYLENLSLAWEITEIS